MAEGWGFILCTGIRVTGSEDPPPDANIPMLTTTVQGSAPMGMYAESHTFLSTLDPILAVGSNWFFEDAADSHRIAWVSEQNYEVSPGVHLMEGYLQYENQATNHLVRPIAALANRATDDVHTLVQYRGVSFDVTDGAGVVEATWDETAGMTLGRASKASTLLGANLTATIGGNVSIDSAAGFVQLLANGGLGILLDANALQMRNADGSSPYTAGDWAVSPPATLQAAINRMSALLKTLNGGNPIP